MPHKKRVYGLGIWGLGLGYYLFYTPYSGLTKALSNGVLPGIGPVAGTVLLPASVMATIAGLFGFITAMGWWKYAGRRQVFGLSIPFPRPLTFVSGICMATIMATTTLAFAFGGISIVLVLVLLRGGVLMMGPVVDALFNRRVRWFSWAAMWISLLAVAVVLSDAANYKLSFAAMVDVAAYLTAYFFKFQFMTKLAKSTDLDATRRYFVEEQMVASPLLLLVLALVAATGFGDQVLGFRFGFTTFLGTYAAVVALLVGLCYAGLCICTTLIFLDRRENTFCVPMHCGSSMLSGFTATYALTLFLNQKAPSEPQIVSAGLIVLALVFLSPLHHYERYLAKIKSLFPGLGPESLEANVALSSSRLEAAGADDLAGVRHLLFVCSGNTCRSPMAATIGNAEIAARLCLPVSAVGKANVHALSAGVRANVGAPMTSEAKQALRELGFHPNGHQAQSLTIELVDEVERIFCMTQAHRKDVLELAPAAAEKTMCLDPERDIEDPIGKGMADYLNCARQIHSLVRKRFDELNIVAGMRG